MELETAVERLYTDESIAADVDDRTAQPLLKWAETLLPALVTRGDEGFDEAFATLRKLVKSVARLIDMRGELDMTERAERAEKIQSFAQELGIQVNIDHLEALASFDGPELVAQMVGGVNATTVESPPLADLAKEDLTVEQQRPSDINLPAKPEFVTQVVGDIDAGAVEPPPVADVASDNQTVTPPELPAESQVGQTPQAGNPPEDTAEPRPESADSTDAGNHSLLAGIGAFFQRLTDQLDGSNDINNPDDKE